MKYYSKYSSNTPKKTETRNLRENTEPSKRNWRKKYLNLNILINVLNVNYLNVQKQKSVDRYTYL